MLDIKTYEERMLERGRHENMHRDSVAGVKQIDKQNEDDARQLDTQPIREIISKMEQISRVDKNHVEEQLKTLWPKITKGYGKGKLQEIAKIHFESGSTWNRETTLVLSPTGIGTKSGYEHRGDYQIDFRTLKEIIKHKAIIRKGIKPSYLNVFDELMVDLEKIDLKPDYKDIESIDINIVTDNIKGLINNDDFDADSADNEEEPISTVQFNNITLSDNGISIAWKTKSPARWSSNETKILDVDRDETDKTRIKPMFVYVIPILPKLQKQVDKYYTAVMKDRKSLNELSKLLEKYNSINEVINNL